MEIIKRKILLESSTDRTFNSPTWGVMTADTFYINVFITQNIDDMGLFTDMDYIPYSGGTPIMTGLTATDEVTLRTIGSIESDYYSYGNLPITGYTDSKIEDVRSYSAGTPFIVGFDMASESYTDYTGGTFVGVSRVVSVGEPSVYVFDAEVDPNIGTNNQKNGLQYADYTGTSRNVVLDGVNTTIPLTTFRYVGEGLNETNVSLSALTKEEYLFGVISPPEVKSDVFIERGITTIMEMHLRLSEIKDLGELSRYGNGFYKLTRQ